jgi:hypothetical protein
MDPPISIRAAVQNGVKHSVLAARYGIGKTAIGKIVSGKTWKSVQAVIPMDKGETFE